MLGMASSTAFMSRLKRFSILPRGVTSKKFMGAENTDTSRPECVLVADLTTAWAVKIEVKMAASAKEEKKTCYAGDDS